MSTSVSIGDALPDATLRDQDGRPVRLHELTGRGWLVVYFYPKDGSPGCTAQACSFRDAYDAFRDAGAEVVGISSDDAAAHASFTSRHALPFRLLSDDGGEARRRFGIRRTFGLLPGRVTYVVDRDGIVRHVFDSQFRPAAHIREAIAVVRSSTPPSGG